ncbi:colanic acid exporter [Tritonibacter multivorans]|uniref:Colanic acid exporter n=1 Tax=Tritonibacter multivorans TaxID=928856 RepID=A0A0P1GW65_9RHOB|nr:oligosaccharide flippase family protein [Tritonibacter multivorans]MDA7422743.1 oligosaccharide flippase family protein [Tritonibacter multivorans]CUH80895.1 colanic acid exporter [Tritonibacter multivorans]SFD54718.1 Membrane protein involved in the export of O-antigen and teichoic acid [Tritonibacter multivorans]
MLRKVLMLLSGNAAASVMLLARNLLVARLIPVEDYGIAATFAITMALVEMSTQFGLQQQIIQSKDGEDERFQAALQGFQLLRGVLAGALLFALAGPIATLLRIPEVAWAYQVMAVMPVLRSLQHFDIHRLSRSLRYGPMLLTAGVPALVSLLAVYPLALWLGDFRVMLFALVLQEALGALTSQVMAERRYRLVLDRKIMAGSLRFGWPLLLNGFLLFAVMQGDKIIVGRELGMVALGLFGMGVTLTLTPTLILAKSAQNLFLPLLSAALRAGDEARFVTTARAAFQASLLIGLVLMLAIFVLGVPLLSWLFGDKFADLGPLLIWLAAGQAVRVFKSGPSTAAVAKGITTNALLPNLIRLAALPLAWGVVLEGGTLWHVVLIALGAELLGYFAALALAQVRLGVGVGPMIPGLIVALGLGGIALILPVIGQTDGLTGAWPSILFVLCAPVLLIAATGDLRRFAAQHFSPHNQEAPRHNA